MPDIGGIRTMSIPRILYIAPHWPGAPAYGAQQRVLQIGHLLKKIGNVSLVVLTVPSAEEKWRSRTKTEFNIARVVTAQSIGQRGVLSRLRHELDSRYVDAVQPTDRQAVLNLLSQHDVVWVHTMSAANSLGIYQWPHSVLDMDDIPSRVYESSARVGSSLSRRLLDRRMSLIWKRREMRLAERFKVLMVCSENDRRYLGMDHVRVLPNGFQRVSNIERFPSHPSRIGFIGSFEYAPNVEGMRWFCAQVWPKIKEQLPDACLRVVGDGTDIASEWGGDVYALGRVEDAGSEIGTWSAMIVPIRRGGGTRIKVLEGFARRCPVVATKLGAFGYDINDGEEVFLTDEPNQFAVRCIELIKLPQVAETMANSAHQWFLKFRTWESYEDIVRAAVESVRRKN